MYIVTSTNNPRPQDPQDMLKTQAPSSAFWLAVPDWRNQNHWIPGPAALGSLGRALGISPWDRGDRDGFLATFVGRHDLICYPKKNAKQYIYENMYKYVQQEIMNQYQTWPNNVWRRSRSVWHSWTLSTHFAPLDQKVLNCLAGNGVVFYMIGDKWWW